MPAAAVCEGSKVEAEMKDTGVPDLPGFSRGCCSKCSVLNQTNPQVLEQVTGNTCQRGHYPLTPPVMPRRCQGRFEVMPAWETRPLERCRVSAAGERENVKVNKRGRGQRQYLSSQEPVHFSLIIQPLRCTVILSHGIFTRLLRCWPFPCQTSDQWW